MALLSTQKHMFKLIGKKQKIHFYALKVCLSEPSVKIKYSKTCVKQPLKNRQNKDPNDKL